jgi:protein-disulfide isomerase
MNEIKQKITFFLDKYSVASSIVLAAIIISGTIFFTRTPIGGSNTGAAKIGDTVGQNQAAKLADVKINSLDHVLGNKNAKVSIIEYSDFRCPFCERFFKQTEQQLINDYVNTGKANFVFRHFAFLGPQSTWSSEAAECASEQGKFWEFHNWLYNNQAPETNLNYYSKVNLIKYAGKIGLDATQFSSCLNSDKYAKRVSDDSDSGKAAGVTGTPTIFINGQKIVGAQPYETFKAAIEQLLK